MNDFDQDWRQAREEALSKTIEELRAIGDHRRLLRRSPDAIRKAMGTFDRKTLPAREIAELVDLTETRVRQIADQEADEESSISA
jgi:DNA-directed RNA polymerase sigma subunit (sigma70/sigma32)